jgi:CheY-like chemotaxis protein
LLVEDHASSLRAIAALLRRDGHEVCTATSMATARAAAQANPLDWVISDLGLPDGSGTELMTELHAEHGLRGIALTGYGADDEIAQSRAAGFVAHLVKPVSLPDLRRVLAELGVARR